MPKELAPLVNLAHVLRVVLCPPTAASRDSSPSAVTIGALDDVHGRASRCRRESQEPRGPRAQAKAASVEASSGREVAG